MELRRFEVPLDHREPGRGTIEVVAREVNAAHGDCSKKPGLVFLQGGPGFESPRPLEQGGWISEAAKEFRVFLLDQRGTGLSTPVTTEALLALGDARAQAEYLACFRSDAIVDDCEAIRKEAGIDRWTLLGQSFGGFCSLRYLSAAPEGLAAALITGGIPGIDRTADEVYAKTYATLRDKNDAYFEQFPADVERCARIAEQLHAEDVWLPNGDRLTVQRFQSLGFAFGMSYGASTVHYLIEQAFAEKGRLGIGFLRAVEQQASFDDHPIFAILHEPIYAQEKATNWAAQRALEQYDEFVWAPGKPLRFTGEMIYPWMFEDFGQLAPLREAANLLAERSDWPRLYDAEQLARNTVPTAAAVYHDDMYVPRDFSIETAKHTPNVRTWITNEYEHNGLRADGPKIFAKLLAMTRGEE